MAFLANISSVQLLKLQQAIPEATDVFFTYAGSTCPTPPLASDAPYVLCQNNFEFIVTGKQIGRAHV